MDAINPNLQQPNIAQEELLRGRLSCDEKEKWCSEMEVAEVEEEERANSAQHPKVDARSAPNGFTSAFAPNKLQHQAISRQAILEDCDAGWTKARPDYWWRQNAEDSSSQRKGHLPKLRGREYENRASPGYCQLTISDQCTD
jgi:hypothetical protein